MYSENERLRFSAAMELCKIAGASTGMRIEETAAMVEEDEENKRFITAGMLMHHMLNMSDLYEMSLPPKFVEDVRKIAKKTEELAARNIPDTESTAMLTATAKEERARNIPADPKGTTPTIFGRRFAANKMDQPGHPAAAEASSTLNHARKAHQSTVEPDPQTECDKSSGVFFAKRSQQLQCFQHMPKPRLTTSV